MPEWLLKNDNYSPFPEKDTFVNKTILALIELITRLRTQSEQVPKKLRINISLKVASTFFLIILISTSKEYSFLLFFFVYSIVQLAFLDGKNILEILKICLIVSIFTLIILIPSAMQGNYYSITMITTKVFLTILTANIMSRTSNWHDITSALKSFFVADIFILVLDITIKYISLLGEFSLEMLFALKLRSVGKNKSKYASLSGVAGTMFIKSTEMAEEMYIAMECRGFSGDYIANKTYAFSTFDILFLIINISIFLMYLFVK